MATRITFGPDEISGSDAFLTNVRKDGLLVAEDAVEVGRLLASAAGSWPELHLTVGEDNAVFVNPALVRYVMREG